jgi:hypothetical protein
MTFSQPITKITGVTLKFEMHGKTFELVLGPMFDNLFTKAELEIIYSDPAPDPDDIFVVDPFPKPIKALLRLNAVAFTESNGILYTIREASS